MLNHRLLLLLLLPRISRYRTWLPEPLPETTTLAAMLEHINANPKRHIVTLEDPIEFVFEDNQSVLEQREIGLDTRSQDGLKHVSGKIRHHHGR